MIHNYIFSNSQMGSIASLCGASARLNAGAAQHASAFSVGDG